MNVSPSPPTDAASSGALAEIRRALNAQSLALGAATALVLAVVVYVGLERHAPAIGRSAAIAALFAVATFCAITLLHVTLHGYFGWRFARGIRAVARGRLRAARRLLAARAWPGMAHYDASGDALRAWRAVSAAGRGARAPASRDRGDAQDRET